MGAELIDDFIRNILAVPFCPCHFVHTILSNTIFSVYHFVHTILSATIFSWNPLEWFSISFDRCLSVAVSLYPCLSYSPCNSVCACLTVVVYLFFSYSF